MLGIGKVSTARAPRDDGSAERDGRPAMTTVDRVALMLLPLTPEVRQVAARRGDDAPGDAWPDREPVILPPPIF